MIKSLLNRFKNTCALKDFQKQWIATLKTTHLPLITTCLCSPSPDPRLLSTQVRLLHNHFSTYFSSLDLSSNHDVSQLLFPERNPLQTPFLWLGDVHPYIFTNLLRSFFDNDDDDVDESLWNNRDSFVEQLECGLRLMVPCIVKRARDAQVCFVQKLGVGWVHKGDNFEVGEIVDGFIEEMTCVFLDANRLRTSVLSDIMRVLSVHQAALFLQGLAQFYVGFSDPTFNNSNLLLD